MKYTVTIQSGPILCGKCGSLMRADEMKRGKISAVIRCERVECEQHDVPLVFPLNVVELKRVEG